MQTSNFGLVVKKGKSDLTYQQRTFNKLIESVQELKIKQEAMKDDLEIALKYYCENIKQEEDILLQKLIERFTIAYQFYQNPKNIKKSDIELFKSWLTYQLDEILFMYDSHNEIPSYLKDVFKELNDIDFDESISKEFDVLKDSIEEQLKQNGIDINLSDLDINKSREDIINNMFQKIGRAFDEKSSSTNSNESKAKTKKQIEKELKKQAFEKLQSNSLNAIYKQLVKTLHPDLEQNIEKRIFKEELMKKLTTAYENNDLYSLLKIEIEAINNLSGQFQSQNEDEIKIYNSILKDQIKELENSINMIFMHPRYYAIQKYYGDTFTDIATLKQAHLELKQDIKELDVLIAKLKTDKAKALFDQAIKEHIKSEAIENLMSMFIQCQCGEC